MDLIINNLNKEYKNGVKAINDISLKIGKGMYGLLGQNGAGKSSLMRTIATLQDADSGSIFLGDIDVFKEPDNLRKTLGYLPQEFGVYPNLSAYEMMLQMTDLKGISGSSERKELSKHLLDKVNLYEVKERKLGTYSGGMKQRFGIAQALIGNPSLIIVDEPTAGLDPTERNRFYNLLSEIGENAIVVLSTHIVDDISTLCNHMAIIGKGSILREGKPDDLETELNEKLWEKQIPKDELDFYTNHYNVLSTRFHLGKLLITVLDDEMPDGSYWRKIPTLEDVYFNCTHHQSI